MSATLSPLARLERDLNLLAQTSAWFNAPLDWAKAIHQVIRSVSDALDATVALLVPDSGAADFRTLDHFHRDAEVRARYADFERRYGFPLPGSMTAQAFTARSCFLIPDLAQAPELPPAYLEELGMHSYLTVPIVSRDETLGMFSVMRHVPDCPLDEADVTLIQAIADQAANAIANARFIEHEVGLRQRAETLLKIAKAMRSELDLQTVLQEALDVTWQLLRPDFVGVLRLDDSDRFRLMACTELTRSLKDAPWEDLPPDSTLHRMLQEGHPVYDLAFDLGALWQAEAQQVESPLGCVAVPLLRQGRPAGLFLLLWREATAAQLEEDHRLVTGIAELVELAIENQGLIQREAETHSEKILAEEIAKEREALIRQIVHDLRNSTQTISLINEEIELAADGHSEILLGVAAIDRQISFISNFLKEKLSWVKQTHGQPQRSLTDLYPMIDRIAQQFLPRFTGHHQHFEAATGQETIEVLVSEVQLAQMVGNLLDNAHKYASKGATIKLWSALSDGWVTIYVADDGPGIPLDHQPRIGEVGFRGRPEIEGSGLGLANVKKLVTSNGGLFGFSSRAGSGSTFYVTLPTTLWGKA